MLVDVTNSMDEGSMCSFTLFLIYSGIYKVPHKIIKELRDQLEQTTAGLQQNKE